MGQPAGFLPGREKTRKELAVRYHLYTHCTLYLPHLFNSRQSCTEGLAYTQVRLFDTVILLCAKGAKLDLGRVL